MGDALVFSVARVSSSRAPDHGREQDGEMQGQGTPRAPFSDPLGIAGRGPLEAAATGRAGTGGGGGGGGLGAPLYLGQASERCSQGCTSGRIECHTATSLPSCSLNKTYLLSPPLPQSFAATVTAFNRSDRPVAALAIQASLLKPSSSGCSTAVAASKAAAFVSRGAPVPVCKDSAPICHRQPNPACPPAPALPAMLAQVELAAKAAAALLHDSSGQPLSSLQPGQRHEFTVKHDIKELVSWRRLAPVSHPSTAARVSPRRPPNKQTSKQCMSAKLACWPPLTLLRLPPCPPLPLPGKCCREPTP